MSGETDDLDEDIIDTRVQSFFDWTPGSDLDVVDADVSEEVRRSLKIVPFLATSPRRDMPLALDAVAIRLGLVGAPTGTPEPVAATDDVARAIEEITHRFSIDVSPAMTDETEFVRRYDCRSMVENVLVVVTDVLDRPAAVLAHARSAFALSDELSAVAYSSPSAQEALVLTYADCHQKLEPARGWSDQGEGFDLGPLVLVLSRYFEQSDPQWETVGGLGPSTTLDEFDADVTRSVVGMKRDLAEKRVLLSHKIAARDLVISIEDATLAGWVHGAQRSEMTSESIVDDIREIVRTERS